MNEGSKITIKVTFKDTEAKVSDVERLIIKALIGEHYNSRMIAATTAEAMALVSGGNVRHASNDAQLRPRGSEAVRIAEETKAWANNSFPGLGVEISYSETS